MKPMPKKNRISKRDEREENLKSHVMILEDIIQENRTQALRNARLVEILRRMK